jgi:hypothetical protein
MYVRIALLADGRGDRALLPILSWLVRQHAPEIELPEPGFRARLTDSALSDEISRAIEMFRPEIMFVHRDAEAVDFNVRRAEIPTSPRTVVRVVPVRMTEAWLLLDEVAIRRAADRPDGREPLDLPTLSRIESISDPKTLLRDTLLRAANVTGRRRKRFQQGIAARVQRIAELVDDFSALRQLSAFRVLEQDCREHLGNLNLGT